jgi:hypothetical protein
MKITVGRTVLYVLSQQDAEQINRRRTTGASIAARIKARVAVVPEDPTQPPQHDEPQYASVWPLGAQAHIGNQASEGDVLPAVVVKVWNPDSTEESVNLQVTLDGNDNYWATSRHESKEVEPGTWHWPVMANPVRIPAATCTEGAPAAGVPG